MIGLLKKGSFVMAVFVGFLLVVLMTSVSLAAGSQYNMNPLQGNLGKGSSNASDPCILQGLKTDPSGQAAWDNLRGGPTSNHVGVDLLPYFKDASTRYKIPLALSIGVGYVESKFVQTGANGDGAIGVMQTIRPTFDGSKTKAGFPKGKVENAKDNTYVGIYYLSTGYSPKSNPVSDIDVKATYHNYNPNDPNSDAAGLIVLKIYTAITACEKSSSSRNSSGKSATFKDLKQYDFSSQVATSGCGVVSTAMALSALGTTVDVEDFGKKLAAGKAWNPGIDGFHPDKLTGVMKSLYPSIDVNVNVPWTTAKQALENGQPVVFGFLNGPIFTAATASGHYNLLYGYDAATKTYGRHDPNHGEGTYKNAVTEADIKTASDPIFIILKNK